MDHEVKQPTMFSQIIVLLSVAAVALGGISGSSYTAVSRPHEDSYKYGIDHSYHGHWYGESHPHGAGGLGDKSGVYHLGGGHSGGLISKHGYGHGYGYGHATSYQNYNQHHKSYSYAPKYKYVIKTVPEIIYDHDIYDHAYDHHHTYDHDHDNEYYGGYYPLGYGSYASYYDDDY